MFYLYFTKRNMTEEQTILYNMKLTNILELPKTHATMTKTVTTQQKLHRFMLQ